MPQTVKRKKHKSKSSARALHSDFGSPYRSHDMTATKAVIKNGLQLKTI